MPKPYETDAYARAFNCGAQARLNGWPTTTNPYPATGSSGLHAGWLAGWRHCAITWGCGVRGRWEYALLPPVRERSPA